MFTSKMKPIKGYFKVERLDKDGKILSTYEDYNTIMARVPALYAGLAAGMLNKDVQDFCINSVALGTAGTEFDGYGNEIPKMVSDDRVQLFSEENFWNDYSNKLNGKPTLDIHQQVTQRTWEPIPYADTSSDTSTPKVMSGGNQGQTFPIETTIDENNTFTCLENGKTYSKIPEKISNTRTKYRSPVDITKPEETLNVQVSYEGNTVTFIIEMGQYMGNYDSDEYKAYTEAALYMRYLENNSDSLCSGDTLGQLFSMKTFPPQYKNSSCTIRIVWKLYF